MDGLSWGCGGVGVLGVRRGRVWLDFDHVLRVGCVVVRLDFVVLGGGGVDDAGGLIGVDGGEGAELEAVDESEDGGAAGEM